MSSKMMLMATSLNFSRPFSCVAASAGLYQSRLVPQPPDLIKWVRREGGFVHHSIKIAFVEDEKRTGLGLVASEDIAKGDLLISLPSHIPLRFEAKDRGSDALIDLARQIPEELWAMKLGLKLLQERAKKGSLWWPYISNLPETLFTVPIFFSGEDIKNLQYAPLLHQVNKRCRFLLEFDRVVKNALGNIEPEDHPFSGQDVDASSLGWALSAVSSRAFRLYGSKHPDRAHAEDVHMLLPLIDMCNHSFKPNAEIVQEKDSNNDRILVKVVSGSHIRQEDPVQLNYGCLNNDLFLLDYGFIVPSNPYDCIELRYDSALLDAASTAAGVSSPKISSPSSWQQQLLSQLNLDGENSDLKVRIGGSELVEGRLLAALRVLLSDNEEAVQKHDLDALKSITSVAPLGRPTDAAAFRTLIALCVIALSHFPTKIMEDEACLKHKVPETTELAIRYRIEKKTIIVDAMREFSRMLKLLEPVSAH